MKERLNFTCNLIKFFPTSSVIEITHEEILIFHLHREESRGNCQGKKDTCKACQYLISSTCAKKRERVEEGNQFSILKTFFLLKYACVFPILRFTIPSGPLIALNERGWRKNIQWDSINCHHEYQLNHNHILRGTFFQIFEFFYFIFWVNKIEDNLLANEKWLRVLMKFEKCLELNASIRNYLYIKLFRKIKWGKA